MTVSSLPSDSLIVSAISSAWTRVAVDRHDPVACLQPDHLRGRCHACLELRRDRRHGPRRLARDGHEQEREDHDREHDVRRRPGARSRRGAARSQPSSTRPARARREARSSPFSAEASAAGETVCRAERLLEVVECVEACLQVVAVERALDAVDGPGERRGLLHRAREATLGVVRDRTVHARDGHEAAERDRADPVLDAVPRRLRDRGREADVEAARPEPDGERREEVPRLVDEDEEREAEDRDEDAHAAGANLRSVTRRACSSASTSSPRSRRGRAVDCRERVLDERRDLGEADAAVEERGDRDLVRRVERARVRTAALSRLAGEREQREALGVRRLELEREPGGEVEARHRRRAALGVRERERDRHAHVRIAEVRERGAVAEAHERVDDRGRMHDDLDPLVLDAEQVVRLDQLEALVRERGGVDRDLRAHGPRGMRERLLHGH